MMSFADALYQLSTERLQKMALLRDMDPKRLALAPNKRQLVQIYSNELARVNSITDAIYQCSARELRLLQIITTGISSNGVKWQKVLDAVGGKAYAEALESPMTRLEDLGLAVRGEDMVYMLPATQSQVPISLPDRYTLSRCLTNYDVQTIKRVVNNLKLRPDRETKAVLVEAICSHLLENGPGLRLVNPLAKEELEVLEHLALLGGAGTASEVAEAVLPEGASDFFRYDWQNRWKQGRERNAIDTLLARGMLYVVWLDYGYNLMLVIPGDLLRVLTGGEDATFWTSPPLTPSVLEEAPALATRHSTLLRDAVMLLAYMNSQECARTNTGHIHKGTLKNLARNLTLQEDRYAIFLYAVCRAAGLIHVEGEKAVYTVASKGRSFLQWSTIDQIRTLFEAWRSGTLWAEMYGDPLSKSNSYRPEAAVLSVRRAALDVVTEVSSKAFYDLSTLTDTLAYRAPLILTQTATLGGDLVPSPAIFMRLLVGECLYWMGAVELGWRTPEAKPAILEVKPTKEAKATRGRPKQQKEEDVLPVPEAVGYQITPLGRYLLDMPGAVVPEPEPREDRFILQANSEIFVPPYLDPVVLFRLLSLTEIPLKGATAGAVSLTREAIRRSLDRGEKQREIVSFFQAHSRSGIPQNVEYLINEISSKHGHIHVGKAQMYVQVDTPLLLKELEARKELKPFFVRALSDTVALLQGEDLDRVLRELRKAGYLPVSDEETPPATMLPGDGRHRPAPVPSAPKTKVETRVAKIAEALDWERIAKEDGTTTPASGVYQDKKKSSPGKMVLPEGATTSKDLIRFLVAQAINQRTQINMAFQLPGEETITQYTLRPLNLYYSMLTAVDADAGTEEEFNLSHALWLQATKERF